LILSLLGQAQLPIQRPWLRLSRRRSGWPNEEFAGRRSPGRQPSQRGKDLQVRI